MNHELGRPIADTVRHQAASIDVRNHDAAHRSSYRAIEYTYVYESVDAKSESAMAHGYVIDVGEFTVFVQHTADRVVTSDVAQNMAMELVLTWSKNQTSIPKGWSGSISRSHD